MRVLALLLLLPLALAQQVWLEPRSWQTQAASLAQILAGSGEWTFPTYLVYETPSSGTYQILLELVPAGPVGVALSVLAAPGAPERLGGTGALGNLAVAGTVVWPAGFRILLQGVGPGVRARLPLDVTLKAQASGPLAPGYYFLQATVLIVAQ